MKGESAASTPPPQQVQSSGSTLASRPTAVPARPLYPTPDTTAGPSRIRVGPSPGTWDHQRPKGVSSDIEESDSNPNLRQVLGEAPVIRAGPSHRRRRTPTPPPIIDDVDIAMAEEEEDVPTELIPDSSPPPRPQTPPRPKTPPPRTKPRPSTKSQAIAELEDIPPDLLFSPPPQHEPVTPRRGVASTSTRPIRTEASASRSVHVPKPIRVEVRHPWSKEVDQKLRLVFKLSGFRLHQKEAVDETMAGKDGVSPF
jgi:bloom syndrome protein